MLFKCFSVTKFRLITQVIFVSDSSATSHGQSKLHYASQTYRMRFFLILHFSTEPQKTLILHQRFLFFSLITAFIKLSFIYPFYCQIIRQSLADNFFFYITSISFNLQQVTKCPAETSTCFCGWWHTSFAYGQRVAKRQPGLGLIGDVISPRKISLLLGLSRSVEGIAESSALV